MTLWIINRRITAFDFFSTINKCSIGSDKMKKKTDNPIGKTNWRISTLLTIKDKYTKVLKGHISVALTNLKKINTGRQIDLQARKFLKKDGLDYSHGTGHGVGFFLNVHEGPQAISKYNSIKLKEGMILSNEPGYYKEGHYGIRIENLIYIKKENNKLKFENLTLAPLEKDLINFDLLNNNEKDYLFKYHLSIYSKLSNYLNKREKKWLSSFLTF